MGHTVKLKCGDTTLTLSDGVNYKLLDENGYHPVGGLETIGVGVMGASKSATQSNIQALENILGFQALQRKVLGTGAKAYVEWTPEGLSTAFEAEIQPRLNEKNQPDPLSYRNFSLAYGGWGRNKLVPVDLHWERVTEFQQVAATEIGLTNTHGSNITDGLQFDNTSDSSRESHASISASDVGGALPGPVDISLANDSGQSLKKAWIALGAKVSGGADPVNLDNTFEVEDATTDGTYFSSSDTIDASASNGKYVAVAALTATKTSARAKWSISSAQAGYAGHAEYKAIARFHNKPSNSTITAFLTLEYSGIEYWRGPEVILNSTDALQEIGDLRLPPYLPGLSNLDALDMVLYLFDPATGGTCGVDFVRLMPTDSIIIVESSGGDVIANNETLYIADTLGATIEQNVYVISSGGKKRATFERRGSRAMLSPNGVHELHVLVMESDGDAPITLTYDMQVDHKPWIRTV